MSGALSGQLVDAYNSNSSVVTSGSMSFNPMMHGHQSFAMFGSQFGSPNDQISEETAKKIATLQVKLNRKLGPEYISQRPGPGGGPKLTYVEGWKVINLANEVFGFNGWSSNVVSLTTDFVDYNEETKRYCIGVTAIVRVTLRDGVFHEDIGYGMLENTKSKGAGLDKSKKEAVTDGLKRALRNFGNLLGNCLYDKSYTAEIVKIKVEPPKLNNDELHRRPEFENVKTAISNPNRISSNQNQVQPRTTNVNACNNPVRLPVPQNPTKLHTPSHLRSEVQQNALTSLTSSSTNSNRHNGQTGMPIKRPQQPVQPITPVATPLHAQPKIQHHPQQKCASLANIPVPHAGTTSGSSKTIKDNPNFDSDDTFGYNEEEFLALADVAADIGRPIGEGDLGRPIDHEEGSTAGTTGMDNTHTWVPEQHRQARMLPQAANRTPNRNLSRAEIIAAALESWEEGASSGSAATNNSTKNLVQSHPTAIPTPASCAVSASSSTTSVGASGQQHQQQTKATPYVQQRHQQYIKHRSRNENENPVALIQNHQNGGLQETDSGGASTGVKRPTALSMGGSFNFPQGMKLQSPISPAPVIGIKRPAEALSTGLGMAEQVGHPSMGFKGGRPGMGLQQAVPGPRQVLGALEIGEGGDVKRVRR